MHKKELIGIQYLRAIAAIFVILDHTEGMSQFPKYFNSAIVDGFLISGAVGVHLFFGVSGFIITYVSLNKETLRPSIQSIPFLKRRFIRIIPFMWLCILGYAALRFLGRGSFPAIPYLRSFFLFPIGPVQPNQIWTLRHEFLFYGIFCFSLIYLRSWKVLIFWFLTPIVWFMLDLNPSNDFILLGDFIFNKLNILFGAGFLVGLAYLKGLIRFNIHSRFGFLACTLVSLPLFYFAHITSLGEKGLSTGLMFVLGVLIFIVLVLAISLETRKPLNKLDNLGLLLGDASYSIYLTHPAIISSMLGAWSKYQPDANLTIVLITICLTCLVVGALVHIWIEKPLIRFVQNKFSPNSNKNNMVITNQAA